MKTKIGFPILSIFLLTLLSSHSFAGHIELMEDEVSGQKKIADQIEEPTLAELLKKTDPKILEKAITQTMNRFSSSDATLIGTSVIVTTITVMSALLYFFPPPPSSKKLSDKDILIETLGGGLIFAITTTGLTYATLKIIERNKRKKIAANFAKMLKKLTGEKHKIAPPA